MFINCIRYLAVVDSDQFRLLLLASRFAGNNSFLSVGWLFGLILNFDGRSLLVDMLPFVAQTVTQRIFPVACLVRGNLQLPVEDVRLFRSAPVRDRRRVVTAVLCRLHLN